MAKAPKTSRKNKRFTESEFETVRKLADAGLTEKQITEVLGGRRNPINLIMVNDLKTWSDYKAKRKEQSESRRVNQKPPVIVEGELPEELPPTVIHESREDSTSDIHQALLDINATLKELVQAWQNEPKKRKLF